MAKTKFAGLVKNTKKKIIKNFQSNLLENQEKLGLNRCINLYFVKRFMDYTKYSYHFSKVKFDQSALINHSDYYSKSIFDFVIVNNKKEE